MLRETILGLGVGTLCTVLVVIEGTGPAEIPESALEPPRLLALGGEMVDLTAEAGPGCFAPMLEELRRHPHWSVRIDDLVWDDVVGNEPDERRASILLGAETSTWRDGWLPQSLTLAEDERRQVLAAFALDCRVDPDQPPPPFGGRYIGIALGEVGDPVVQFPTNSFVALRLEKLFDQFRERYLAGRAEDLHGFSLELAGTWRADRDERGRPIREPHRVEIRESDLAAAYDTLEGRVRLLDWALTQPATLPAGAHAARGTLRAHGTSRPIAVDLDAHLALSMQYSVWSELSMWAAVDRPDDD
ncbi:MAG TPA: hypothetical protein VN253_20760 [Kofleriaceae bacterium]|nr:hypothetical protein [Kofleriaceae bacterium]